MLSGALFFMFVIFAALRVLSSTVGDNLEQIMSALEGAPSILPVQPASSQRFHFPEEALLRAAVA